MAEQTQKPQEYSEVDWSNIPSPGNNAGGGGRKPREPDPNKVPFMKFESGAGGSVRLYKIRPVGKAIQFYMYYAKNVNGTGRDYSIRVHPKYRKEAEAVLSEFFGTKVNMKWRCATFILSRDENNAIRLLEGGSQMFQPMSIWSQMNGNLAPGDNAGGNWAVQVTGSGMDGPNPRKYAVSFGHQAPFTPDEVALLKSNMEKMKFSKHYKLLTPDEIVPLLTGANKKQEPAQAATPAGAAAGDPLAGIGTDEGQPFNTSQW